MPEDYIVPLTKDFPIREEYLEYVIEHIAVQELVENVHITKAWGGDIVLMEYSEMRISPNGIDYLRENNTVSKIASALPEAAPIIELFSPIK